MPVTLSTLTAKADVSLDVKLTPEDTLRVTYRPYAYTVALDEVYREALSAERGGAALAELLAALLVSWDLVNDKGKELATTPDVIKTLPLKLLAPVIEAIGEDLGTNPKSSLT